MSATEVGILLAAAIGVGWPVSYLLGKGIERERQEMIREEDNRANKS